jgi:hypothetical protein
MQPAQSPDLHFQAEMAAALPPHDGTMAPKLLLSLSMEEIAGIMAEAGPTVISIKSSRCKAVQRATRFQLRQTRLFPDDETEWKKLFLLPILLLSYISDSVFYNRDRKSVV